MKTLVIVAIGLIILIAIILFIRWKFSSKRWHVLEKPFLVLRNQVLFGKSEKFGIADPKTEHGVWGVQMETTFPEGTNAFVALRDGSSNLYLETGTGIIGGGSKEYERNIAVQMVEEAEELVSCCKPTRDFPLPPVDSTTFYVLARDGVYSATAPWKDLGENRHPLSVLFHTAHEIIAQLRKRVE
jgi:hypothetical protein